MVNVVYTSGDLLCRTDHEYNAPMGSGPRPRLECFRAGKMLQVRACVVVLVLFAWAFCVLV